QKKDYAHAFDDYSEAIKLGIHNAQTYENRGRIYAMSRNIDRAIADYSEAIRIEPSVARFRARCVLQSGTARDLPRARDDCNEALRLDPTDRYAHIARGMVLLKLSAFYRAIADYSSAVSLRLCRTCWSGQRPEAVATGRPR